MSIDLTSHAITYSIIPVDPAAHLFKVILNIAHPNPLGQIVYMPAWIPGSYKIREFAKNITQIQAYYQNQLHHSQNKNIINLKQLDKHSWQAEPCLMDTDTNTHTHTDINLIVTCYIYAYDLSVRTIYLDEYCALINFSSLCLAVKGQEHQPCHVILFPPCSDPYNQQRIQPDNWQVITSLPRYHDTLARHFGAYYAVNYDALIDYPVYLAPKHLIQWGEFKVNNTLHIIAVVGHVSNLDIPRLIRDTQAICTVQTALFDPDTHHAPFLDSDAQAHYTFMTQAVGDGYGGLEHRASTALICKRSDLPNSLDEGDDLSVGYQHYLGLISHEYFHTWLIKRIKPANFVSYDLTQENYTSLLWLFEGFTAYYDDLMLVRASIITPQQYLDSVSKTISSVLRTQARLSQSVADASFNAWVKYYNPDANSPNVDSNYYTQGSLIALYLDLYIRLHTRVLNTENGVATQAKSLDDVMQLFWQRFGNNFYKINNNKTDNNQKIGVTLADVYATFNAATGLNLQGLIESLTQVAADIPLQALIEQFGITWTQTALSKSASLGANIKYVGNEVCLASVYSHEAAHKAGLSGGDCLISLDKLRVTPTSLPIILMRLPAGETVHALAWRRDELIDTYITLDGSPTTQVKLSLKKAMPTCLTEWLQATQKNIN
jgi:predicted metalloprotease with PDZ domain